MKINQFPSEEQFNLKPVKIGEYDAVLITPKEYRVVWTPENLIFRSSVWTLDGYLISASYKKFFNFGETEFYPNPQFNGGEVAVEKIDGSTLIVSKYRGNFIIRTRGTIDARQMENGHEIDYFVQKFPVLFSDPLETWNYSFIFEWVTPKNKIVIGYDDVDFILTGLIGHEEYTMSSQKDLDKVAENYLNCNRPKTYSFSQDLFSDVKQWEGKEGVCIYFGYGQNIRKLKSEWYLKLHRAKSDMTAEKLTDLFLFWDCPAIDFSEKIATQFDWEIAVGVSGEIASIVNAYYEMKTYLSEVAYYVFNCKHYTKKQFALEIKDFSDKQVYFCLFDGKEIPNKFKKDFILSRVKNG